jgi:hypothetical protein
MNIGEDTVDLRREKRLLEAELELITASNAELEIEYSKLLVQRHMIEEQLRLTRKEEELIESEQSVQDAAAAELVERRSLLAKHAAATNRTLLEQHATDVRLQSAQFKQQVEKYGL